MFTRVRRYELCMTDNAAERELRDPAVSRKNLSLVGSDEGGRHAAARSRLPNSMPSIRWLADLLAKQSDHPASRLPDLLP